MIYDYMRVRNLLANNGYELTPAEAKEETNKFNKVVKGLYPLFCNLTIKKKIRLLNKIKKVNKDFNIDEFNEIIDLILVHGEENGN